MSSFNALGDALGEDLPPVVVAEPDFPTGSGAAEKLDAPKETAYPSSTEVAGTTGTQQRSACPGAADGLGIMAEMRVRPDEVDFKEVEKDRKLNYSAGAFYNDDTLDSYYSSLIGALRDLTVPIFHGVDTMMSAAIAGLEADKGTTALGAVKTVVNTNVQSAYNLTLGDTNLFDLVVDATRSSSARAKASTSTISTEARRPRSVMSRSTTSTRTRPPVSTTSSTRSATSSRRARSRSPSSNNSTWPATAPPWALRRSSLKASMTGATSSATRRCSSCRRPARRTTRC